MQALLQQLILSLCVKLSDASQDCKALKKYSSLFLSFTEKIKTVLYITSDYILHKTLFLIYTEKTQMDPVIVCNSPYWIIQKYLSLSKYLLSLLSCPCFMNSCMLYLPINQSISKSLFVKRQFIAKVIS